VTGAMACSTALLSVAFVRRLTWLSSRILADLLSLAGCCAALCPCVVYGKNKQRLQHLQNRGTPLPGGGERYNADCCIHGSLAIAGYAWVLQVCRVGDWPQVELLNQGAQISSRADIRARYGIRGGTISDCFTSWCCRCCSLTQERREIELEENSFEGFSQSK
jgi:Cys-rich protein (TIGR01571 family)